MPPIAIGIIGGSISRGGGVRREKVDGYAAVLGRFPGVRVINRAVGATGCASASYCLEELLPEHTDFLLIEYAMNDAGGCNVEHIKEWAHASFESMVDGSRLNPDTSMERLLRRIALTRSPRTVPLLLNVCNPRCKSTRKCEGLYARPAAAYNVTRLSFVNSTTPQKLGEIQWAREHPNEPGHRAIAELVYTTILHLARAPRERMPLPPLESLALEHESPDEPWHCKSCDWRGCASFQPVATNGFTLDAGERKENNAQASKFGWAAYAGNASKFEWAANVDKFITFEVPSGARVLLAFLCSWRSGMGTAHVSFEQGGALRLMPDSSPKVRNITLRWRKPSSQQCLVDAGGVGYGVRHSNGSLSADMVRIRVSALSGKVKVFGAYWQTLGSLGRQLEV